MKLNILNKENKTAGNITLPKQFNEEVRPDLIKRAVLALQAARRQKYGANPKAGTRASVRISKRRHDYRTTYGIGQSRTPRKVMSYRGSRFNWTGAFAPQTVSGRRAHPAKPEKDWEQKINDKERKKAICSALAATVDKEVVTARGHKIPATYPFVLADEFETLNRTKDIIAALKTLGLEEDLKRAENKKIRAGRGTMRGRKYKQAKSVLLVTSKDCDLSKAAINIPGVDVINATELNTEELAPGAAPGRLTLYTESAIKTIEEVFGKKKTPAKKTAKKAEVSA